MIRVIPYKYFAAMKEIKYRIMYHWIMISTIRMYPQKSCSFFQDLFCMFVHSNESQNKHAFNPVIILLTENIRRSAYDAFILVSIYFTFCFLLDWSPQRWSRTDDSFSVFPELIHWSGFFHFSFPPLSLPRCEEFSWYFRLFSPFLEKHNSRHSVDINNPLLQFKEGLYLETKSD